jgi:outer membrane protein
LIFYGSEYIIYTIPDDNIAKNLLKDKVSFYLSERDQDGYVNVKIASNYGGKQKMAFKKSIHYSNVYFGGYGADILWSGKQNTVFDYNLYFYYYFNSLHCDAKLKTSFQKDYYNPYIETGEINKMIDYNVVKDPALLTKIKVNEIQNISGVENAIKEGVSLAFKPSGNIKMIYPLKKITYNYVETVKGKYAADGTEYKGEFLYFKPGKTTNHYGYQQYDVAYPKVNLLSSIADINTSYKMSRTSFNSIYKAFSNIEKESAYFTSSEYIDFYNAIFELVKGEKSNMPIIGTRSKGTTQHSTPIIENNQETEENKEEHEEINGTNRHGYINLNELVNNSPEYKSIVLKLEELNEIETSIIKLKEIDLTEKLNQYQKEAPSKTKEENELRAKEIEDIQQDIQEYSMNANTELVRKQTELIDSLMGKIIIIIQEVANSKKISTVIDSSDLKGGVLIVGDIDLFMQNGYNLMTDVKKELGIK